MRARQQTNPYGAPRYQANMKLANTQDLVRGVPSLHYEAVGSRIFEHIVREPIAHDHQYIVYQHFP